MTTPYEHAIKPLTTEDPRHVEAFMRLERGTLDALSPDQFAAEVSMAVMCINEGGKDMAETLAKSYGF